MTDDPSCVAPPAVRSAAVALPRRILSTRKLLTVVALGTRQTLASYLSMHTAPETTASGGHFVRGPLGGPAAPAAPVSSAAATAVAIPFEMCRRTRSLISVSSMCSACRRGRRRRRADAPSAGDVDLSSGAVGTLHPGGDPGSASGVGVVGIRDGRDADEEQ